MKRSLCVFAMGLALSASLWAADAPKKGKATPPPAPTTPRAISGRTQLETLLQAPAKLDFDGRHRITVREILDKLHEHHRLSLRFDSPTLAALLEKSQGSSSYHSGQVASGLGSLPLGLITTYSSTPVSCAPVGVYPTAPVYAVPALPAVTLPDPSYSNRPVVQVSVAGEPPVDAEQVRPQTAPVAEAPTLQPSSDEQLREEMLKARSKMRKQQIQQAAAQLPQANELPKAAAAPADATPAPVAALAPAGVVPADDDPSIPPAKAEPQASPATGNSLQETIDELLESEVDVQTLDLSSVSIATILRHALDAVPTTNGDDFAGMPILVTNASLLDYLIEDDGLLITSRMKALSKRETRVYSLKQLSGIPPEQLAKTIRQSIRPWSWRSQINDLGDQLKGTPLPAETMTSLLKSGVQLISAEAGVEVTPSEEPEVKPTNSASDAKQMEMLGGAVTNGLVTLAHSTLLVMEMMHYAEPPTATIQTLGNKLIVTQSQAAHREIAELLKQLSDE